MPRPRESSFPGFLPKRRPGQARAQIVIPAPRTRFLGFSEDRFTVFPDFPGWSFLGYSREENEPKPRRYGPMNAIRVLLVDDNPAFCTAARRFLNRLPNVEVVASATTAAEAMERVAMLKPNLVLMDLVMPRVNGLEATRLIKQGVDQPKIVVLTLHSAEAYRSAAEAAGADGFITKDEIVRELPLLLQSLFAGRGP
jgi:CheY-like chemotaxis protein